MCFAFRDEIGSTLYPESRFYTFTHSDFPHIFIFRRTIRITNLPDVKADVHYKTEITLWFLIVQTISQVHRVMALFMHIAKLSDEQCKIVFVDTFIVLAEMRRKFNYSLSFPGI
jgi:heme/copper-type cytochrome/quinol oxidase subunit 4